MTLYANFLTAKEGTEAYTTALYALADALGLTRDQAIAAGDGIHRATKEQIKAAEAAAKGALDEFNRVSVMSAPLTPKTYRFFFGDTDELKELFDGFRGEIANIITP